MSGDTRREQVRDPRNSECLCDVAGILGPSDEDTQ